MYELHRDIGTIHQPAAWAKASTCKRPTGRYTKGYSVQGVIVLSVLAAVILCWV